jgi:hypothetical protein
VGGRDIGNIGHIELILAIDDASLRLPQFDAEIGHVNVTTEVHFQAGTLTPSPETAEGDVIYMPKRAIADYVKVLGQLRRSLAELQGELAKAPRGSPWRRLRQLAMQPCGGGRAVVLGIWCIATAAVAHSNWVDFAMKIDFLKNFAMAGGFAYMAAFGAGAFSLDAVLFHRPLATEH